MATSADLYNGQVDKDSILYVDLVRSDSHGQIFRDKRKDFRNTEYCQDNIEILFLDFGTSLEVYRLLDGQ